VAALAVELLDVESVDADRLKEILDTSVVVGPAPAHTPPTMVSAAGESGHRGKGAAV